MNKRERNLLVLLGIVVIVAGAYYVFGMSSDPEYDELGLSVDEAERIADLSVNTRGMPELSIEKLDEEKVKFAGAKRNLFIYASADTEITDESAEDEVDESDETDAYEVPVTDEGDEARPVQRRPTIAGYEYIGLHSDVESGPTAVFSWRGRKFVGRQGQVVNEAFEIKEITRRYVLIHVIKGDFEQRLRLTSPAGATSGGMK